MALGGFSCQEQAGHTLEVQPPTRGREVGHTVEIQPLTRGREGRTLRRSSTTNLWERRQDTP